MLGAAAAALVFSPVSLFADDLQNCDPTLQAPLCAPGMTNVTCVLSVVV